MVLFKSDAARMIDKFNEKKFNLCKFKIKMLLASMDHWDIVERSEEPPSSNADPKVLKEYQRHV